MQNNEPCFEFSVVIPVFVLGPTLHNTQGTSETRFLKVLNNKTEKLHNIYYSTCDVRDVAKAHVRAALLPEAVGHRHLITSSCKFIPTKRWVEILSQGLQVGPGVPGDRRHRRAPGVARPEPHDQRARNSADRFPILMVDDRRSETIFFERQVV